MHTGSFGRSLHLWNHPADEVRKEAGLLWNLCLQKNWTDLGGYVDRLSERNDFSLYEELFMEIIQLVRNAYFRELNGTEKLFSGDSTGSAEIPENASSLRTAVRLLELCDRSIAAVKARANITLVLAHFAIALSGTLNGEKQQSC